LEQEEETVKVKAREKQIVRWEYIVREMSVETADKVLLLEDFLNVSGQDGWEVVGVASAPGSSFTHLVYLKRPRDIVKSATTALPEVLEP